MKVYLDTNVLMDLFCNREFGYITDQILDRAKSCEFYVVISDLVIIELNKYIELDRITQTIDYLGVKAIVIRTSKNKSFLEGLHFPDNVHMHTAIENNCDVFVTNDSDFFGKSFSVQTLSSPFL